jgi:hypothetical protein
MAQDHTAMFARVRANAEKACFVAGDLFEIMQVIAMAERVAVGEAMLREWRDNDPEAQPDGTLDGLATCATMLENLRPDCFPADEHGRVTFARSMMDATAMEIRAFLIRQQILPKSTKSEGQH